jgi:hypothetical protein
MKSLVAACALLAVSGCQTPAPRPQTPETAAQSWQKAAADLSAAFLARGDVVGAARAQDYIYRLSHGQGGTPMPGLSALPETVAPSSEPAFAPTITCSSRDNLDGMGGVTTTCR